jgi:nucleoside-diphosphate-sugar epimerase
VLKPFSQAVQIAMGSLGGLFRLIFSRHKSYPGLADLLAKFYASIQAGTESPIDRKHILDTVRLSELIGAKLKSEEQIQETRYQRQLVEQSRLAPIVDPDMAVTLVTGGSGFLGKAVVKALRSTGNGVRALCRRVPPSKLRVPGVEYVEADLGNPLSPNIMDCVQTVIHLAAETAGNQAAHERNTIQATQNLLRAMESAGVRRLINISSVAVLRPGEGSQALNENSAVDRNNLARGPYVWAKAEAEALATERAESIQTKTLRLGPLVDYGSFAAPGRLGREVARLFVAVGKPSSALSVCDVGTAAAVIRHYVVEFETAPPCVNLLEVPAPTRGELVKRLRTVRPDLRFVWLPFPVLKVMSKTALLLQKMLRPKNAALDLYAAFKSEHYDLELAGRVIEETRTARRSGGVS